VLDLERWNGLASDTFHIAAQYAQLGESEEAIQWPEKLRATRAGLILWIKLYPQFKGLHNHPRFQQLTRDVGLA
jgi:hypothetical protein